MKEEFDLTLSNLLHFVKASCHESLHDTLNEIRELNKSNNSEVAKYMKSFIPQIQRHLIQEDNLFFREIESGKETISSTFVAQLLNEHDLIQSHLLELRFLTQNYNNHEDSYIQKIKEMDRILSNHIQLENNILFPMVLERYFHQ